MVALLRVALVLFNVSIVPFVLFKVSIVALVLFNVSIVALVLFKVSIVALSIFALVLFNVSTVALSIVAFVLFSVSTVASLIVAFVIDISLVINSTSFRSIFDSSMLLLIFNVFPSDLITKLLILVSVIEAFFIFALLIFNSGFIFILVSPITSIELTPAEITTEDVSFDISSLLVFKFTVCIVSLLIYTESTFQVPFVISPTFFILSEPSKLYIAAAVAKFVFSSVISSLFFTGLFHVKVPSLADFKDR